MVAINLGVDNSVSINLAKPLDAVGKLEITTSISNRLRRFNTGTGTLIAPNKILTAAHVIDNDRDGQVDVADLSQYSFLLGDDLEQKVEHNLSIARVALHPLWTASEANRVNVVNGRELANSQYDLAVLTLTSDFTEVAPIPLAPSFPEFVDVSSLLGKKATIVGYGQYGRPNAILNQDDTRRAAENIIDSVANGLIRFDYDSTFSFEQDGIEGLNHPNLNGSTPDLIPIPQSSPLPLALEGGIGKGDSGGPLLVTSDLNTPVVAGVASKFIDTEATTTPISGYGSIYVYAGLNQSPTLAFLEAEAAIDLSLNPAITETLALLPETEIAPSTLDLGEPESEFFNLNQQELNLEILADDGFL